MLKFRPRYSLRTLFVLITVSSVVCWLWGRSQEFALRAEKYYLAQFQMCSLSSRRCSNAELLRMKSMRYVWLKYCETMEQKYRQASKQPWLPVAVDLPQPERPPEFLSDPLESEQPWDLSSFMSD